MCSAERCWIKGIPSSLHVALWKHSRGERRSELRHCRCTFHSTCNCIYFHSTPHYHSLRVVLQRCFHGEASSYSTDLLHSQDQSPEQANMCYNCSFSSPASPLRGLSTPAGVVCICWCCVYLLDVDLCHWLDLGGSSPNSPQNTFLTAFSRGGTDVADLCCTWSRVPLLALEIFMICISDQPFPAPGSIS